MQQHCHGVGARLASARGLARGAFRPFVTVPNLENTMLVGGLLGARSTLNPKHPSILRTKDSFAFPRYGAEENKFEFVSRCLLICGSPEMTHDPVQSVPHHLETLELGVSIPL